jgi:hypothetical protein
MKVLSGSLTGAYSMRPVDKAQDRIGRKHAVAVRQALAKSWNADQLIRAWREASAQSLWTRQQTADWVKVHVRFDDKPMMTALANLYAEAVVFGRDAAEYELRKVGVKRRGKSVQIDKADDEPKVSGFNFDWANWTPGNLPAALLVNPPAGLAKRLADRHLLITGVNETTTNRIGTVLAEGLAAGINPVDVATGVAGELIDSRTDWAATLEDRLKQIDDDVKRAEVIARTEMGRAVFDEKLERYDDMGVQEIQWITVSPCDECAEIDQEVVPIGESFSNGWTSVDDSHPNCNCTIAPVIEGFDINIPTYVDVDDIEMALNPSMPKREPLIGVPDSLDVDRALARLEILPNPAFPALGKPEKYVESAWTTVPVPTVDPNIWDTATIQLVNMADMFGTDPYLKRKNVAKHIEVMGSALLPFRSYAMLYEKDGQTIIIDGHHRLMSLWLLGLDKAPVWLVKESN